MIPVSVSPSRYIARMNGATGREVLRPIDPEELLITAHRDKNPFEVTTSDGRAGALELASGDALKADLYAYYAERCGLD